jgi:hypothetical protein
MFSNSFLSILFFKILTISLSSSTKTRFEGDFNKIFSVKAQYHGQTSMIFFQEIHKTEEISFKISSFTKKFCQSDFLAFILYFFIKSKLIFI